jgi:fucose permease
MYAIAAAVGMFIVYCFMAEANCGAKHSPTLVTILCRLVARHIKLGFKMFVGLCWFIFALVCVIKMQKRPGTENAPEGHFVNFLNRVTTPAQLLAEGVIGLLGWVAIGVCCGLIWLQNSVMAHPVAYAVATISVYALWLFFNVYEVVSEEVVSKWVFVESEDNDSRPVPQRILTSGDCFLWSVVVSILWLTAVGASFGWLTRVI